MDAFGEDYIPVTEKDVREEDKLGDYEPGDIIGYRDDPGYYMPGLEPPRRIKTPVYGKRPRVKSSFYCEPEEIKRNILAGFCIKVDKDKYTGDSYVYFVRSERDDTFIEVRVNTGYLYGMYSDAMCCGTDQQRTEIVAEQKGFEEKLLSLLDQRRYQRKNENPCGFVMPPTSQHYEFVKIDTTKSINGDSREHCRALAEHLFGDLLHYDSWYYQQAYEEHRKKVIA